MWNSWLHCEHHSFCFSVFPHEDERQRGTISRGHNVLIRRLSLSWSQACFSRLFELRRVGWRRLVRWQRKDKMPLISLTDRRLQQLHTFTPFTFLILCHDRASLPALAASSHRRGTRGSPSNIARGDLGTQRSAASSSSSSSCPCWLSLQKTWWTWRSVADCDFTSCNQSALISYWTAWEFPPLSLLESETCCIWVRSENVSLQEMNTKAGLLLWADVWHPAACELQRKTLTDAKSMYLPNEGS